MKRGILTGFIAASLLVFTACEKEDGAQGKQGNWTGDINPTQIQRALVWETTGTWCGYCPNGAEALALAEASFGDLIIPMVYHTGDPLTTPTGSAMSVNFPTSGVPNFYVNSMDAGQSIMSPIQNALAERAVAGVGHEWQLNGNKFTIDTRVQFYEPANGVFMVSSYLVSGSLPASGPLLQTDFTDRLENRNQGGVESSFWKVNAAEIAPGNFVFKKNTIYQHKATFINSATENPWGEQILSMQMFPGDVHEFSFELTAPDIAKLEGAKIATIIWKKQGESYIYVNGYMK